MYVCGFPKQEWKKRVGSIGFSGGNGRLNLVVVLVLIFQVLFDHVTLNSVS